MTYLSIRPDGDWYLLPEPKSQPFIAVYVPTDEALRLFKQWEETPYGTDHTISGVLADYLEEHREQFAEVRPIEDNWTAMIDLLRSRFRRPKSN